MAQTFENVSQNHVTLLLATYFFYFFALTFENVCALAHIHGSSVAGYFQCIKRRRGQGEPNRSSFVVARGVEKSQRKKNKLRYLKDVR